ncbi:MAG: MBOAT family protein [Lachnospiraceae bacterium]|nr:MBOAT family protein [Lachnospiraceae bacterium]
MLFNSFDFIIFFPVTILFYYLFPVKFRNAWLLVASIFFYACFDLRCVAVLFGVITCSYFGGRFIESAEGDGLKKAILAVTVLLCIGALGVFKYLDFFAGNINRLSGYFGMSVNKSPFSLIVPVGISFYTFKSVSYVTDVYHKKIPAEKNYIKYSLFVSFFLQITAGPIDRADNLLKQINTPTVFNERTFRDGILLMLWGYFEKMAVADRIGGIVDAVYSDYTSYSGAAIVYATICYGIQIYADFSGYSHISIGAAKLFGLNVKENFKQPYLAVGIKDFWSRWHISMSTWFKDYVYIPLGGNRKGRVRKYINNMLTFLLSGLWHGSAWNYIAWGGLHGLYHIIEAGIGRIKEGFVSVLREQGIIKNEAGVNREGNKRTFSRHLFNMVVTFIMVDYAWLFFRAEGLGMALKMTKKIFTDFRLYTVMGDWIYGLGLPELCVRSILAYVIILFAVDVVHENGISIIKLLDKQGLIFRWLCYVFIVLFIVLIAVQNMGQGSADFIYFKF